jgi:hypothetical protein
MPDMSINVAEQSGHAFKKFCEVRRHLTRGCFQLCITIEYEILFLQGGYVPQANYLLSVPGSQETMPLSFTP